MQRPVAIAIAIVAVIIVAAVVWTQFTGGEPEPEPAPPPPPPVAEVDPPRPEPPPPPIVLPPLDESDDPLRAMIEGLSAHPRLHDAIAADRIVRAFVTGVVAIANGESPRSTLLYLEPEQSFAIAERDGKVVIDPASFERYTWITGVFSSLAHAQLPRGVDTVIPLIFSTWAGVGPARPISAGAHSASTRNAWRGFGCASPDISTGREASGRDGV